MIWSESWCVNSRIDRIRVVGENEQLKTEAAMFKEELRIKDARAERIPAASRPHYLPAERLAILALKATRGWNNTQAAKAFQLTDATIASWLKRIDEAGPAALVQTPVPINKYPDFVGHLVQQLKATCPTMGKVRISQMLAKAGLHLSPSTAKRLLSRHIPYPPTSEPPSTKSVDSKTPDNTQDPNQTATSSSAKDMPTRIVRAKCPGHVWHVDLTVVPTALGFWIPWFPFAVGQRWPFCYWVVAVLDHFSRKAMLTQAFRSQPSTEDVTDTLDIAIAIADKAPKYLISDQGRQFRDDYELWCQATGIKPRLGAIGQHGSIAILERFNLSLKNECTRRILVPLSLTSFQDELCRYVVWYNTHRPHQSFAGCTPNELYHGVRPARDGPRFKTRRRPKDGTNRDVDNHGSVEPVSTLRLVVTHLHGRQHLPIVKLERAA